MPDSNSSFFEYDSSALVTTFNGVPAGGADGEVLTKTSATDYAVAWETAGVTVTDATLSTSDITTNDFSTVKHGFVPKGPGLGKFLKDDGTWAVIAGGGDALVGNPLSQFAATTSLQLKNTISDETGSGSLVFATSPTLVTPVLGVATATSINGATITSGTLNGSVTGTNTGDETAGGILTKLLTVDGAASGLDADLLDGLSSAAFATASHTHAQSDVTSLVADLAAKQPLDSDLTTIAALTATTDSFIQSKASAWASRTVAQVKTDLGLTGTNSGDQTITLTGDVTGSGTGSFVTTIAAGVVTLADMVNMATSSLIYRKTAGTGVPEVNTLATLKTDLGLTGTNSGDQTITLTGDVTGSGTGSFAATIATSAVTLAKMANMATASLIYRRTAASGAPEVNTLAQLKTDLALVQADIGGLTTASSPQFATIELGSAADTTLTRSAAGQIAVENKRIINDGDRAVIGCVINGGGVVITTGIKGDIGPFTYACTIEDVTLLADQSGSIVVDIWKVAYASYPPVVGNTITASAKPTISAALKSQDTTLTGWGTAIAVGDILRFNVDSVTTVQRVTLSMKVKKT